jgi:hypothetical protein
VPGASGLTPTTVAVSPGFTTTENNGLPTASLSSAVTECLVESKLMTLSVPPTAISTAGLAYPPKLAPVSIRTVAAGGASAGDTVAASAVGRWASGGAGAVTKPSTTRATATATLAVPSARRRPAPRAPARTTALMLSRRRRARGEISGVVQDRDSVWSGAVPGLGSEHGRVRPRAQAS